jgi:hypothetical protein
MNDYRESYESEVVQNLVTVLASGVTWSQKELAMCNLVDFMSK